MEKIIAGCQTCPFYQEDPMFDDMGTCCHPTDSAGDIDVDDLPIPLSCPLKTESITIKFQQDGQISAGSEPDGGV